MIVALTMLACWQYSGDNKYYEPFKKSVEASYTKTELNQNVDKFTDKLKDGSPDIAKVVPIGYALYMTRQIKFISSKVTPFDGTTTSYNYDNKSHNGKVNISWHF